MKFIFKHIITIVFLFLIAESKAQDIHFSQFFASPLNVNPANTGNFEGDYRFVFNNKNQWQSFANAYRTFAGSIDANFSNLILKKSISGLGLQINNDIAGDGRFGTTQIYLNSSFYLPLNKECNLFTGLGINVGYVFHGIEFDKLKFGNQYSGEYFNPEIYPDEYWDSRKINYFDLGMGFNFIYKSSSFIPKVSLAISHINTPGKSFYNNSNRHLPVKWTFSSSADYKINTNLWIEPLLLIMYQQKYSEYNLGVLFRYDYSLTNLQSIYFGTLFRAMDASILCIGAKYNNVRLSISYDINISKLTQISKGRGGLELSLIYILFKTKTFESPHYRKCPDFI